VEGEKVNNAAGGNPEARAARSIARPAGVSLCEDWRKPP